MTSLEHRHNEPSARYRLAAVVVVLLILLAVALYFLLDRETEPHYGWRITEFDAQVTVHASGAVDMVETITYDFGNGPSHGLTRELPETGWIDGYGWRDFGLTNVRGKVLLALWDALTDAGIEIPFPQRDVHLKSGAALAVKTAPERDADRASRQAETTNRG
jgi:hypothetical protein